MITTEVLTELLGWASLINIGVLTLSSVMLILMRGWVTRIHAKLFGIDETNLSKAYFQYLAQYKIATLIFNVAPYLALKIMA